MKFILMNELKCLHVLLQFPFNLIAPRNANKLDFNHMYALTPEALEL